MPNNEHIMLDSLALSAVFPDKTPLERLFLGFLLANTASTLCGDYQPEQWTSRQVSESLTYLVPTYAETYSIYLPDTQLTVTLSADAFGLAVTSIVLARVAVLDEPNEEAYRFCALQEYAQQHPENDLIRAVMTLKPEDAGISPSWLYNNNNHH
ncbi:antirestriction protein [Xenorhabdus szentirmaii]|uniref:Antirestriction protein n=1 Tax=Xenorhabdus mauleonii TaxID=351675 RepID=A0A1I3Y1D7_9GAMM|nr:antirestriction protein [Xenorhabdus mauleonii]PHM37812.1 antirestriction protein [Xenorhabdus mauleonii]SFK25229.1 Antirestriction protein [Xenorhabdus mauleonii]